LSNVVGETPTYMADSSRESPRRGTGRLWDKAVLTVAPEAACSG
jgi:hypothetical protein